MLIKGQTLESGPVIKNFGKVFKVKNQDYKINKTDDFHVLFDVSKSPKDNNTINKWIETAARFLNMHLQNGIPLEYIKVVIVIHGSASKDVMNDEAYLDKYGIKSPNTELNKELLKAKVQIIMCGQSAASNGIKKEDLLPGVQLSLSAMTALVPLQNQNYSLINF